MSALAAAEIAGCAGVGGSVTLDDLFEVFEHGANVRRRSWAWCAFEAGVSRPCDEMVLPRDPFDGSVPPPPGCDPSVCLFAGEEARG